MQLFQWVSAAGASFHLSQLIAAVAMQQLKYVSAAAATLQLLQLIAGDSMQPLEWVSVDAASLQLLQRIAAVAITVAVSFSSCSFIALLLLIDNTAMQQLLWV